MISSHLLHAIIINSERS